MTVNERLLKAIKSRTHRREQFGYGIRQAIDYVATLEECVGNAACNRFACTRSSSFDDVKKKAARTLVYANDQMLVEDIPDVTKDTSGNWKKPILDLGGSIPKRTLMVFKHRLTTPLKDRDGDILETSGAILDPKMLLLWQHVHTLPIGKMLAIDSHTEKGLVVWSAIVDMNELCHDAAVMVDEEMARFSHGFRALEFEDIKGEHGFHITKFEVMEESVVSVPSNVEADVEEVVLSMVEGGKLTSGLMKQYGKQIRLARPKQISLTGNDERFELVASAAILGYEKGRTNENITGNGSSPTAGGRKEGCSCGTSKEANGKAQEQEEKDTRHEKVTVPERYASIDFSVNKGMKGEAQKGIDWREEFNRGGTQVGVTRANQILNDGELSPDTWKRVYSYFSRHEVDKKGEGWSPGEDGFPSAGRIAWALWGGDPGKSRSESIVDSMKRADEESKASGDKEEVEVEVEDGNEEEGGMMECPECGTEMEKGGICPECGYEDSTMDEETQDKEDEEKCAPITDKAGRTLSKANEAKLNDCRECLDEVVKMEMPRACKSLCKEAGGYVKEVLASLGSEDSETSTEVTAKAAMAAFLSLSTADERRKMKTTLEGLEKIEANEELVKQFSAFRG